ncbi:MAG TPA: ureidoglycolate lyase [Woeseiaceae bacterium]|nr:ureidoglycolate lyase [Woeseiaceae bacterium]
MNIRELKPLPLTKERFAAYGDVIETGQVEPGSMNDARFERYNDLCSLDAGDGRIAVSIACSRTPSSLPHRVDMVERHPLGSQAFIPLTQSRLYIVVAPAAENVETADLVAFESNGRQGINYHRGTWHMPLLALESGQRYLIIDRAAGAPNCDIHRLDEPVLLLGRDASVPPL